MSMPRHLIFIRHGESEGNLASGKAGAGDYSHYTEEFMTTPGRKWNLTEAGVAQATMAGEWLRKEIASLNKHTFETHYYASPYVRTKQTAGHLNLTQDKSSETEASVVWKLNRSLRERDWGDLDNMPRKVFNEDPIYKLSSLKKKNDPLYWRPPGGESIQDVAENRVRNFLDTLHRECSNKTVVAVTHGEFMKAARIVLERANDETFEAWEASEAGVIRNCEVIQYTKFIPKAMQTGKTRLSKADWDTIFKSDHLAFVRRAYPSLEENSMIVGEWEMIRFNHPTNEELMG